MSILEKLAKLDAWLSRPCATVYNQPQPPPKDDLPLTLMLFAVVCISISLTCGHYLAK
jgi:hypothetical protein